MPAKKPLPYGTWPSPISAAAAAKASRRFGTVQAAGGAVYWSESRPEQGGRQAIFRADATGAVEDLLPAPFSARSRVHEYGGGEFLAVGPTVYFVNDKDQDVYALEPGRPPQRITNAPSTRFADFAHDAARHRLIAVAEMHEKRRPRTPQERAGSNRAVGCARANHRAGHRPRLLRQPAALRRWPVPRVSRLGPARHAVGQRGALRGGRAREWPARPAAPNCGRRGRRRVPARVGPGGRALFRLRQDRLGLPLSMARTSGSCACTARAAPTSFARSGRSACAAMRSAPAARSAWFRSRAARLCSRCGTSSEAASRNTGGCRRAPRASMILSPSPADLPPSSARRFRLRPSCASSASGRKASARKPPPTWSRAISAAARCAASVAAAGNRSTASTTPRAAPAFAGRGGRRRPPSSSCTAGPRP